MFNWLRESADLCVAIQAWQSRVDFRWLLTALTITNDGLYSHLLFSFLSPVLGLCLKRASLFDLWILKRLELALSHPHTLPFIYIIHHTASADT